jgi:hypothetical protein
MSSNATELLQKIEEHKKKLITTSLDISFNEIVDMIENKELNIQPDFQRTFQWSEGMRSRLIESLILEMPIPPIYVIEDEENKYLLIDGLQRISSYLHFRGVLDAPHLGVKKGDFLSLVDCDIVPAFNNLKYEDLPTALQIRLKRFFMRVEVVRSGSDPHYKYYMFKRLNTGGALLSEQQIRNCTVRLLDPKFNDYVKDLCADANYQITISNLTEEQMKRWYDQELILRFFALKNWRVGFSHDVGDFLTEYMERVSDTKSVNYIEFDYEKEKEIFVRTFSMLKNALGSYTFSRANSKANGLVEGFGIYHFESIAIGCQVLIDASLDKRDGFAKELGEFLTQTKLSQAFINLTKGGGKNSRGLLEERINYISQALIQKFIAK